MEEQSFKIILPTERFAQAPNVDTSISITLDQNTKELVEYDRSVDLSLNTVFDEERESSTIFRPSTKFQVIFSNAYTGSTRYSPFRDNLYYTNAINNTASAFPGGNLLASPPFPNQNTPWDGFPQYQEFDFIRTDMGVPYYTANPQKHLTFRPVSATTYNWSHYLSYPFANIYNKTLRADEPNLNLIWSWVASAGIPFYILGGSELNNRTISFKCPMTHGLSVGEYVELSFGYNGQTLFQVESLGDNGFGSQEYIFNITNVGYTGTTFQTNGQGFFKRVLNLINSAETKSEYYVRRHKIITNQDCVVLANAGFERNIFTDTKKCEIAALTPRQMARTSTREGSRSYTLSFNCDIDIDGLLDNQKRPLTQLFFTTIWRGYFGWTRNLRQGWYFNRYLVNNKPSNWWDRNNGNANTSVPQLSYTSSLNAGPFYYNGILQSGDTIDGDFCEWNNYEQLERVISTYTHKFTFNSSWFTIPSGTTNPSNPYGYFYQPHNPITIRVFSEYIEEGNGQSTVGIPPYAYYSNLSNGFRWRDLYPYGFVDSDGLGVDYPFLNDAHYPFVNTIFRITPESYNIPSNYLGGLTTPNITDIQDPIIDECE
jgi:hypothetical protein